MPKPESQAQTQAQPGCRPQSQPHPKLGALAVVLNDGHVLLALRKKDPDAGLWGYPGGHVEWGETVAAAAVRELREETGVIATPGRYLANLDLIRHGADGAAQVHYLLVAVLCDYVSGTPHAASEIAEAAWVPFEDVERACLPLSAQAGHVLRKARAQSADLSA